jgi:arylsulfatase A-like enzyme
LDVFIAGAVVAGMSFALQSGLRSGQARPANQPRPTLPTLADLSPDPSAERPNIVLICIDTLRADHLSLYGYARPTTPRLDRFARDARIFTRAYATTPFTTPSVVSMLTGLYPYRHGVRVLWQPVGDNVVTLPEWLHRADYATAAVVSNLVLGDEACGLASRFDHYDDAVDEPEPNRPAMRERRAERTTDTALAWLANRPDPQQPYFLWVHYIDPHGPYRPPVIGDPPFTHSGRVEPDPERIAPYVWDASVTDALDYVDRYDEEIRYTDREVGRLIAAIEQATPDRATAIILTADHGEFLLDHPQFAFCHGYGVEEAVTHVPLVVRHPEFAPGGVERPVSIADIAPTILNLAGLRGSAPFDGFDLRDVADRPPPYCEGPDPTGSGGLERALQGETYGLVVRHGLSGVVRETWRQRPGQPREALPPTAGDPLFAPLRAVMQSDTGFATRRRAAEANPDNPLIADDLPAETLEKLRGLGYVD